MTTTYKNDPFATYENSHEKHLQVIYLHEVLKVSNEIIANVTQYAISTIKGYFRKFSNLLKEAKSFFKKVFQPIELPEKFDVKTNCAYVIELLDENGVCQFLKVGKTDNVKRRMTQIQKDRGLKPVVKMLYVCDDEDDALTMENSLRKAYKQKFMSRFIKNDRFEKVQFVLENVLTNEKVNDMYQFLGYQLSGIVY